MAASEPIEIDLELALLRRGLDARREVTERCSRCHRTPLVGERVYLFEQERIACELCRDRLRGEPHESRTVHGQEFGHTMRIIDQRNAA